MMMVLSVMVVKVMMVIGTMVLFMVVVNVVMRSKFLFSVFADKPEAFIFLYFWGLGSQGRLRHA